jgi:hypothetical protein
MSDNAEYTINIDEIIKNKDTISCIKDLFRSLKEFGYVTPKSYFESMSDYDLHQLNVLVEQMSSEEASPLEQFEAQEHVMLLTIGFLVGEGTEINEDTVTNGSSLTVLMITLESLARQGLVKVHRDKWCLTGAESDIWVERI